MKIAIFIILLSVLFSSCDFKIMEEDLSFQIYKTKKDYSDNAFIRLNKEKNEVLSIPSANVMKDLPKPLINNYYLHHSMDAKSVFLIISKSQYERENYAGKISEDSLLNLITENDPFLEFYKTKHDGNGFYNDNGIDTPGINEIIRKGELEKYFERVK